METFPALMALCQGNPSATGGFPSQKPVTRSFDVFFDLRRSKLLIKHSRRRWFETPSRSLWRHPNDFTQHTYYTPAKKNYVHVKPGSPYHSDNTEWVAYEHPNAVTNGHTFNIQPRTWRTLGSCSYHYNNVAGVVSNLTSISNCDQGYVSFICWPLEWVAVIK